jgi:DNA polymerase III subunit beta
MKFTVSSQLLRDNLSKIYGVVGSNNVITILDNFLFTLENELLTVISSDVENSMKVEIPVQSSDSGSMAVPAKKLMDTIKFIAEQPLLMNINDSDNVLDIQTNNGNYKLTGFGAKEFPELTQVSDANTVTVDSSVLNFAINQSSFAIGNDESRKAMTGLYCQFDKDGATFVATDAQKLVRFKRRDVTASGTFNFILPKKVLNQLKTSLPSDTKPVEISFNKNHCSFKFDNIYLICRLIGSQYPDYNAVIPTSNPNVLIVNREELLSSLRRLTPYTSQTTHQVVFQIVGSQLTVSATDIDYASEGKENLMINYNGEDFVIGFNSKYLSEILSTMNSEEVMIEMSTPARACLLFPNETNEKESILMLIMPIMVNQ